MNKPSCQRCGNKSLVRGFISLGCPLCGEYIFPPDVDGRLMWPEHKHGLMFKRDGWRWLSVIEPPKWFLEDVA